MIYEWKRPLKIGTTGHGFLKYPDRRMDAEFEYETTTTMDPPPGEGWKRIYSFGIGAVKGAGLSPSRQVSGS